MEEEFESLDYLIKKFREVRDKKGIFSEALKVMEEQRTLLRDKGHDPRKPPSLGREDAPVTILEFMDFQCPPCRKLAAILQEILKDHGEKVRLVFRNFPRLEKHPLAAKAAEAALCAHDQGRFWEYYRALFENQEVLGEKTLVKIAEKVNMKIDEFKDCLLSGEKASRVVEDMNLGRDFGITKVPTLFINGAKVEGVRSREEYLRLIDEAPR
jgi:protein-disulfide isomerase